MSGPSGSAVEEPTIAFRSIEIDDETVVLLTQADRKRAWIQSDTVVQIEP